MGTGCALHGPMPSHFSALIVAALVAGCSANPPPPSKTAGGGRTTGFELAVVPRIDADNPQVGRASWQYDRKRYAPSETASSGPLANQAHVHAHQSIDTFLSTFNEGVCARFDAETRATCPLLSIVEATEEIPEGVRVVIRKSVDLRAALDHMRCHHSFGRSHDYPKMASCPLYVHGIEFVAVPALHAIEIRSSSAASVHGIQDRARMHEGEK